MKEQVKIISSLKHKGNFIVKYSGDQIEIKEGHIFAYSWGYADDFTHAKKLIDERKDHAGDLMYKDTY